MNDYLLFLDTFHLVAKKIRVEGLNAILKHLDDPARSPILAGTAARPIEAAFMIDALRMLVAGLSIDELAFYMDGHRHRLISQDKADVHLVNMVFRTVWALAHGGWDPATCTEFGRATIPTAHSLSCNEWVRRCNSREFERTQTNNVNWDQMIEEINRNKAQEAAP